MSGLFESSDGADPGDDGRIQSERTARITLRDVAQALFSV